MDSAEGKVQEIGGQVALVKTNLARSAQNAVHDFKEKGVDALRKAVPAMKIPSALSLLREGLHSGMESMETKRQRTHRNGWSSFAGTLWKIFQ